MQVIVTGAAGCIGSHAAEPLYGDGKQVRDVLWVEDLIDLYELAVQRIDVACRC